MGGVGSGRRETIGRKRLVEDCWLLAVADVRRHVLSGQCGRVKIESNAGPEIVVDFFCNDEPSEPLVVLSYSLTSIGEVWEPIGLHSMQTMIPGEQWFFACPLVRAGAYCGRRVRKLFLPHGERYFGCRACHRLTYRACRETHMQDRIAAARARFLS